MTEIPNTPQKQIKNTDTVVLYHTKINKQLLTPATKTKSSIKRSELDNKFYNTRYKSAYPLPLYPSLIVETVKRQTQVLFEGDISLILFNLDIKNGDFVLESGTGSGILTRFLSDAVGECGIVHTFERNWERFVAVSREMGCCEENQNETIFHVGNLDKNNINIEQTNENSKNNEFCKDTSINIIERNSGNVRFSYGGIGDSDFPYLYDAIFLDIPEPWNVIEKCCKSLKMNSSICVFVPSVEQAIKVRGMLECYMTDLRMMESVKKEYVRKNGDEKGIVCCRRQYSHTGFLLFATKMAKTVEEQYQKKTPIEHVLLRPDTYIGSVEHETQHLYILATNDQDPQITEVKPETSPEQKSEVKDEPPTTGRRARIVVRTQPQDSDDKNEQKTSTRARIINRQITYVPGLYKIFDEIIVNAADNKIRDPTMRTIKVTINEKTNKISVYNDGHGIPVVMHKKEKCYIPEMIFGQLLTSSNYDDKEKKVTGGRNGYGAKLCNIFSNEFVVETCDGKNEYYQRFKNNMSVKEDPIVKKSSRSEFTRISFVPDLKRFGMEKLDDGIVSLMKKRVYDLAGVVRNVRVYLNNERIDITSFRDYCRLYLSEEDRALKENENYEDSEEMEKKKKPVKGAKKGKLVAKSEDEPLNNTLSHLIVNDRLEILFTASDEQFQQVSFVNSICTSKGGTHVSHVLDQLIEPIIEHIKKKEKGLVVKPVQVKSNMFIFINCLVENPSFDSQTKENLTLNVKKFGSKCTPIDEIIKSILRNKVLIEKTVGFAKAKQSAQLKKTDGAKTSRLSGIPKLDDANSAGTRKSSQCTLILTEGDSAKALAVSGLGVVGRDLYGVFPLRGKLLNVREASHKQIMENAEICAIKKILGLQHGKEYTSTDSLRYGYIMIMTDQDHDGSHIKGLLINFFDHFFPSLLKIKDFMQEFITPIVRVTKKKRGGRNTRDNGTEEGEEDMPPIARASTTGPVSVFPAGVPYLDFFTLPEFETWRDNMPNINMYKVKYYKGLGTSTSADARVYFSNLARHVKSFTPLVNPDRELLNLAFNKKKADARKGWLKAFVPGTFLSNEGNTVSISDFVNKELILFSMADNIRSIPSAIDGLKPGQRKVLFSCFKRKLYNEIKVAQLAGYVSEHSAYHHGEMSLMGTIINLAQNFEGTNNINLLHPEGQFGTRLQGGKDAASPRYIFTFLEKITRLLFVEDDDAVLNYLSEDNQGIEPEYYVPIIPMVLINGAEGIGTGWSTNICNYNPVDIVQNILAMIRGKEVVEMMPFYRGYTGTIKKLTEVKKEPGKRGAKKVVETENNFTGVINNTEQFILNDEGDFIPNPNYRINNEEPPAEDNVLLSPVTLMAQRYKVTGLYQINEDDIEIRELPIGTWTTPYKEYLEQLLADGDIKDFKEYHTENTVLFKLKPTEGRITESNIEKKLKLSTTISTNNFVCFDAENRIKKYEGPGDILRDFYTVRLQFYTKRKEYMLRKLETDLNRLNNRVRFIRDVVNEKLIIRKRKKADIETELTTKKYDKFESSYDYLLNMSLLSLTLEKVAHLIAERDEKKKEYEILTAKSAKDLWVYDLEKFLVEYERELAVDEKIRKREEDNRVVDGKKRKAVVKKNVKKKAWEKYDDDE